MSNVQNFLITYGLQNFVTHTQKSKRHVFVIKGGESQKMVGHAVKLIKESFSDSANIQMT